MTGQTAGVAYLCFSPDEFERMKRGERVEKRDSSYGYHVGSTMAGVEYPSYKGNIYEGETFAVRVVENESYQKGKGKRRPQIRYRTVYELVKEAE